MRNEDPNVSKPQRPVNEEEAHGIAHNDPHLVDAHGGDHGDVHLGEGSVGYEVRDVSLPAMIRWFAFVLVFVAVVSLMVGVLYLVFVPPGAEEGAAGNLTLVRRLPTQSSTILQADPVQDIMKYREDEQAKLENRGKEPGKLSIDEAIKATAQRGFGALTGPVPNSPTDNTPADISQEALLPAPNGGLNDERIPTGTPVQPTNKEPLEGALNNPFDNNISGAPGQ